MEGELQAVRTAPAGAGSADRLTPRQMEVLRLLARGWSNAQIADELFLSRRTVHAHLREIFRKLDVSHRSAATRYAVEHGLAELSGQAHSGQETSRVNPR
jgi:DNA-binding NarL/FixJ family response regulator